MTFDTEMSVILPREALDQDQVHITQTSEEEEMGGHHIGFFGIAALKSHILIKVVGS